MTDSELTHKITGAAIVVHRELGPGLLELVYQESLCHELSVRNIAFEKEKPIHDAIMLTYLRLSGCKIGLLFNFYVPVLKDGINRFVRQYTPAEAENET
jgi:hypothetical protein